MSPVVTRSEAGRTKTEEGSAGFYYEPGEIETLWVLDIDGTVVVITRTVAGAIGGGSTLISPPTCSTRSASSGRERRALCATRSPVTS